MSEVTPAQWMIIRDRLAQTFGLYLDDSRMAQGRSLVEARSRTLGLTAAAYQSLITTTGGLRELHRLAEQLANHETQFFRNPAHFRALYDHVFPTLQAARPALQPIRCWSAGCATGEEAYSMAMVALQIWGAPPSRPVQVWATDLSNSALERARLGEYRGRALTNVQPSYRHWFEQQSDGMRVGAAVRSLVQFEQHNLLDAVPEWAVDLDVVFCQNVTIYFQLATCQRLIERIYQSMAVGGYLLLGFSESLWGIFDGFETVELQGAFIYRKGSSRAGAARVPGIAAGAPVPARGHPGDPRSGSRSLPRGVAADAAPDHNAKPLSARPVRPILPAPRGGGDGAELSTSERLAQARQLRTGGEQRSALALLNQVPPDERSPAVLALTAQLHADLGQREEAAAEARRALELDVMQDAAYVVLGMLELQHGAWAESSRYLERALYLLPDSPTVSFYLAESYRQQGRIDAARREYRNTVRKLAGDGPTALYDGVAAGWLQSTCERWLASLA